VDIKYSPTFAKKILNSMQMKKSTITRQILLQNAFQLIYVKGYQSTSIDDIIATTHVTKGAFFHHFKNKEEMGLALIHDFMQGTIQDKMLLPLLESQNPLDAIYNLMRLLLLETPFMQAQYGCPTHNLIQEMAPINPAFKQALTEITEHTQKTFLNILEKAKSQGIIRQNVNCEQVTLFILVGYAGIRNIGKLYDDDKHYHNYLALLKDYLNGLKS
jgi:TetR/AcrR family transcriptional regulator, transcriptional repressor for nem operon